MFFYDFICSLVFFYGFLGFSIFFWKISSCLWPYMGQQLRARHSSFVFRGGLWRQPLEGASAGSFVMFGSGVCWFCWWSLVQMFCYACCSYGQKCVAQRPFQRGTPGEFFERLFLNHPLKICCGKAGPWRNRHVLGHWGKILEVERRWKMNRNDVKMDSQLTFGVP